MEMGKKKGSTNERWSEMSDMDIYIYITDVFTFLGTKAQRRYDKCSPPHAFQKEEVGYESV